MPAVSPRLSRPSPQAPSGTRNLLKPLGTALLVGRADDVFLEPDAPPRGLRARRADLSLPEVEPIVPIERPTAAPVALSGGIAVPV